MSFIRLINLFFGVAFALGFEALEGRRTVTQFNNTLLPPSRRGAKYCDEDVCLSVCPLALLA